MMNKKVLLSIVILLLLFSINGAQGSYSVKQVPVTSKANIVIERTGDFFTVDIRDAVLDEVLKEISRENGITFLLPPSLKEEKVMVRFSHLKVDKGLGKILKGYNSIFIYNEEEYDSLETSRTRLKEVRIYSRINKGTLKESFITISDGSTQAVEDNHKNARVYRLRESVEGTGEAIVKDLYLTARHTHPDPAVRLDVVKKLAKAGGEEVIGSLAVLFKDKNPEVSKAAEKALDDIGKILKEEDKDDSSLDPGGEELPPQKGGETTLTLAKGGPGNEVNLDLKNDVPVRGVQFTINGASPLEVRTTSRTEGFFTQYKNGTVIMMSVSGKTIAPGTGPIAEVICSNADSASLSKITISD